MTIDHKADRPLYKQVADLIRAKIENGELAPGKRLPTQKVYVEENGVSLETVKRAMVVLRREGLMISDRHGSRVRPPTPREIVSLDHGTISARVPTEHERRHLGIAEGIPLIIIERDGHDSEI